MKRYLIGLFPLLLCFIVIGCSSSMSNQFIYGTNKEKPGKVIFSHTLLNYNKQLSSEKFYRTDEDSANGNPTTAKWFYQELLQSLDDRDTLDVLISTIGQPDYLKKDGYTISLAFKKNMMIYEFRPADAFESKDDGKSWKLINTESIKYQIPELIGHKPIIEDINQKNLVSAKTQTIAVLDFSGAGISSAEAQALTERLRLELFNTGSYKLVERGMMEQVLEEQGFQQSGCVASECIVEVGNLIGVEMMIGGSISKVGTVYSVSAKIFSVSSGEIVKTAQLDFRGDIGDLMLGGMKKIAQDLSKF